MKSAPLTQEFEDVARRVMWFEEPKQALADPVRFIAYAMTYGVHDDMKVVRSKFSDEDLIMLDFKSKKGWVKNPWAPASIFS